MTTLFSMLPDEIKIIEILPKLSPYSRMILQHVLLQKDLPSIFSEEIQKEIISSGLTLMLYFYDKMNKNKICNYAALLGQLGVLRYVRENGCPWDESTCSYAAEYGHLECLKYARENSCPWNSYTCSYAARGGHLECLIYAHSHGCPWDRFTCLNAARNGHLNCLKYARENVGL